MLSNQGSEPVFNRPPYSEEMTEIHRSAWFFDLNGVWIDANPAPTRFWWQWTAVHASDPEGCGARPLLPIEVRLRGAGSPIPGWIEASTDGTPGGPHSEPSLKPPQHWGFPASECLVAEDVPAGIRTGRDGRARVIAFRTTFEPEALRDAFNVNHCTGVSVAPDCGGLRLRLKGTGARN